MLNNPRRRSDTAKEWAAAILWIVLIFAGSTDALSAEQTSRFLVPFLRWLDPTISVDTIAVIHFGLRKLGHFTEYAILAFLLWRALRINLYAKGSATVTSVAFVICALFACSDEFHQWFVPSRTSSWRDVLIDCFGALVALLVCSITQTRRAVRSPVPRQLNASQQ